MTSDPLRTRMTPDDVQDLLHAIEGRGVRPKIVIETTGSITNIRRDIVLADELEDLAQQATRAVRDARGVMDDVRDDVRGVRQIPDLIRTLRRVLWVNAVLALAVVALLALVLEQRATISLVQNTLPTLNANAQNSKNKITHMDKRLFAISREMGLEPVPPQGRKHDVKKETK